MSGNTQISATPAVAAAGLAAVAALSAYWMSSRRRAKDKDDDIKLILGRMNEMQRRLDGIETQKKERKIAKGEPKKSLRKNKLKEEAEEVADSNANVVPPPLSDEEVSADGGGGRHVLPQLIVTKGREGRASQFFHLQPTDGTASASHHSQRNTQASTTGSTLNLHAPVPVVLISDPGQDLDDEMMFIMARHLVSLDVISLKGVIANLSPSFARARLTRGTLDLLGLHRVPVGIGTDGGDVKGKHSSDQFEETASSYIVKEDGEAARGLESGHRLLQRLYDAAPDIEYMDEDGDDEKLADTGDDAKNNIDSNARLPHKAPKKIVKGGLTVVITSSLKDIAIFVRDNPTLFASKTREVVVMGGCKPVPIETTKTALAMASTLNGSMRSVHSSDAGSVSSQYSASNVWSNLATVECEPDSAHNNQFDTAASEFFYSQCQRMNITLTVVSRYAAYAAKMPRSVYDDLALTGSSIGWRLRNSQRASIDQLWQRACSEDPEKRQGLPPRCDRKWYINTFCGGNDDPQRCCADTAWDLVTGFMQYDTIALLAAIPAVREQYFDPFVLPPLQSRKKEEVLDGSMGLGHLKIEEGRILDLSESSREEEDVVIDSGLKARRRSFISVGEGRRRSSAGTGDRDRVKRRGSNPEMGAEFRRSRRKSCPGARPIQRAIAQAREDNKTVETPFESSGSKVLEAFGQGTRNLIGVSEVEHNLKNPSLLVNLLKTGFKSGILCNHHTQPHIILHLQLRWDNLADTLLTCLMLRSLWDMRLASVLGVIVSICPSDSKQAKRPPDGVSVSDAEEVSIDGSKPKRSSEVTTESGSDVEDSADYVENMPDQSPSTLGALAESIRATLRSIGLSHVKFLVVSGKSMKEHKSQSSEAFRELYDSAPPIGVTLVLTATFTSVWPFADSYPDLFRDKTVRVVHTGGALIWPARWGWAKMDENESNDHKGDLTSEQILVPDPAAQNHRLDMSSARLFYKRAQALSVPMVILSRHVAKECCIPRNFFDVLGSHGGEVGRRIYESERNSLLNLWRCSCAPVGSAARGNLPERCDATWFAENFCAGAVATGDEGVWTSVEAVNLYSPIALLAALPGETVRTYFQTMPFPVRSATHHVIGLTEEVPHRNVSNPSELRSLVVQSLLSASLANESAFWQSPPPMVPVRLDHEQRVRSSSAAGGRSSRGGLANSMISTISLESAVPINEMDMWTFSEAAGRELFSKTVAQTSSNAALPKERTRKKFVMTNENRIAATSGWYDDS